jgi:NAD(P)-dependent dehydrogenase (short-subunit alcohol dehydrogenase family)
VSRNPSSPGAAQPVAVVTGASSGIGEAAAWSLARRGFRLVLAARRVERLGRLAERIASEGGEALPVPADLADPAQTRALIEQAVQHFARIDVLVNNAGYGEGGPIELLGRDLMRRQFEVNLFAPLELCGLVAPVMRRQGGGRIINVGSVSARLAGPLGGLYCASKAAMDAAGDALRQELAPWNIRVVLVVPGLVDTAIYENAVREAVPLADRPENPYRDVMHRAAEVLQQRRKRGVKPSAVGEVIARAATARRPRTRYVTPFSARLLWTFAPLVPDRLIDWAIRRRLRAEEGGGRSEGP